MSLDYTIIVNSFIGSSFSLIASVIVAILYISHQKSMEEKKRVHENIFETYFDKGLLPMEIALSEYGANSTYTIMDVRKLVGKHFQLNRITRKAFEEKMIEVSQRPLVADLVQKNFTLANNAFPAIYRFGIPIYGSFKLSFQFYSSIIEDILDIEIIERTIQSSSPEEYVRSSGALAEILDRSLTFLEKRLTDLKDYFLEKDYETYESFVVMTSNEEYKKFLSFMDEYKKKLKDLMEAMKSLDNEARKTHSLEFSRYMDEQMDYNPLRTNT